MSEEAFPILLSLRTAVLALLIVAPPGLALAWIQARTTYRLKGLVDAAVLLPLVLLRTRSLLRQAMHDEDGQGASLLTLELVVHMLSALLAASVFLDGLA